MLYQHQHYRSVTPISVNTLNILRAAADLHTATPPVPFSSVSLHTHREAPGLIETLRGQARDVRGKGRQRTFKDQHLFSLRGTIEPLAKLIASPDSLGGLNNI